MVDFKEERCPDCPMRELDQDFVPGRGTLPCDVVLVGEGPGEIEREEKSPFTGPSGFLMEQTWEQIEEAKSLATFLTNAYLCFPATAYEEEKAIKACRHRLQRTIELANPKVVVAMGNAALASLEDKELNKTKIYNELWSGLAKKEAYTLVPTFNPALVLRRPYQARTFDDSLRTAAGIATGSRRPLPEPKTYIAETTEDIEGFLKELREHEELALDLETTRIAPYLEHIITLILSPPPNKSQFTSYIIPWRLITESKRLVGDFEQRVPKNETWNHVKDFLEGPRSFIIQNATFDQVHLAAGGIKIKVSDDPSILHYASDERTGPGTTHGLKELCAQYFGVPSWEKDIWNYLKGKKDSFENIPEDILHKYCKWDTPYVSALRDKLRKETSEEEHLLYKNKLMPLREMLADRQMRGVYIDIPKLLRTRREIAQELEELAELLQEICGLPLFSPGSTQQIQSILFQDWGLERPLNDEGLIMSGSGEPVLLATLKKNQDFMKEVEKLNESEEVANLTELVKRLVKIDKRYAFIVGILVYRDSGKDKSTYFDGVAKYIYPMDRCIHPFYHLTGTDTGRLTGTMPSLLNVKNSNRCKSIYAARPGYVLGLVDQAQFEIRGFCGRSRDENLKNLLIESDNRTLAGEKGADLHTLVGKMVFPYFSQSPKWWRAIVKTIVFGVLYGRSAHAIAQRHRIPLNEATEYREKILNLFKEVRPYEKEIMEEVIRDNKVTTPFGRAKHYPFIPQDRKLFSHIKNSAVNMPIQSICSDLNSFTMLELWEERESTEIEPLFAIHDSIMFEIPEDNVDWSLEHIKEVMESAPSRMLGGYYKEVPFRVDAKIGPNWGAVGEEEGFFAQVLSLVETET